MIREVLKYPNKTLKLKCVDVYNFNEELHTLLDDMYETMLAGEGIGLAAIQVGVLKNIFIINMPNADGKQDKQDLLEAINPKIIKSENKKSNDEGCLSVPGFNAKIRRFQNITLNYQNRQGKEITLEFNDYDAVACQHEIDHLNGVLFIDRLSILDKVKFKKYIKKIKQEAKV
jgi:peptide deformylase